MYVLTEEGKKYLEEGLPEKNLIKELSKKEVSFQEAKKTENFNIAFQWAKKNNWVEIKEGKLFLTSAGKEALSKEDSLEELLKKTEEEKLLEAEADILLKRNLVRKKIGCEIDVKKYTGKEVLALTPELMKTGYWRKVKFKPYNVEFTGKKIYPGKKHPLYLVSDKIREIFVSMGFEEMEGPLIETAFWDMDSMFIPQDHPAREVQDTFYLSSLGDLPEKKLVDAVKKVHETGGKTGSTGWQREWKPEIARQLLLRTHTTAVTYREFARGINLPCKKFCIGRVFRNEAADATHLPEFHQVEGFVAAEGLNLRHLMGLIKEFYAKIGIDEIKFKFTYNPYTEPSLEAFGYSEKMKRWIELINSGIFRPEALEPYGINVPVIAWGLAVERLAMFIFEKKSIKDVLGHTCNLKDLRDYDLLRVERW